MGPIILVSSRRITLNSNKLEPTSAAVARSSAGRLRQKAQEELLDSDDEPKTGDGEDESGMLY